mmetsp:Transcript_4913/g.10044  ORF Transcript_4913/g.10044 Transcript_4913/m.10044 type:complete len:344 (+) Transcript_4913:124-1155(+)|eukprot:CAMPEP_0168164498 /NCGR_PEP_ID=MMETSP0139_2-20121125/970_1 /TAXON_ID=44445 /ORGANISM="Pseudo-nitzschia australis, Strain 10249 10 AB" /LENGTH=343 /DNA_ID=CAMNT_0008081521 /DNA_START=92 /DNA_END=1123 /DNA_ORIENTATION=-
MHYGSFARWYVAKLKAQPLLVNVSSGFLLMSTGDVLAQRIEVGAREEGEPSTKQQHHQQQQQQQQQLIKVVDASSLSSPASSSGTPGAMFLKVSDFDSARQYQCQYQSFRDKIEDEIASFGWDKSRTAKMAAWSILFTPFYVGIFKLYDRYLPKKNLPSIAARVGCSFLSSIPINFAFYAYGTFVQHTADWYRERREQRALQLERQQQRPRKTRQPPPTTTATTQNSVGVSYRFDQLIEKTRRKLEAEFVTTIKTSAQFWIPLNFLSFSVVPSHIQPLNLMFFNVFWNCYLSLSQHRKVEVVQQQQHTNNLDNDNDGGNKVDRREEVVVKDADATPATTVAAA